MKPLSTFLVLFSLLSTTAFGQIVSQTTGATAEVAEKAVETVVVEPTVAHAQGIAQGKLYSEEAQQSAYIQDEMTEQEVPEPEPVREFIEEEVYPEPDEERIEVQRFDELYEPDYSELPATKTLTITNKTERFKAIAIKRCKKKIIDDYSVDAHSTLLLSFENICDIRTLRFLGNDILELDLTNNKRGRQKDPLVVTVHNKDDEPQAIIHEAGNCRADDIIVYPKKKMDLNIDPCSISVLRFTSDGRLVIKTEKNARTNGRYAACGG